MSTRKADRRNSLIAGELWLHEAEVIFNWSFVSNLFQITALHLLTTDNPKKLVLCNSFFGYTVEKGTL